jgi:hypothetical protein
MIKLFIKNNYRKGSHFFTALSKTFKKFSKMLYFSLKIGCSPFKKFYFEIEKNNLRKCFSIITFKYY